MSCVAESRAELEQISAANQTHPDVLEVRWGICVQERQWDAALEIALIELTLLPEDASGWLHRAYALRRKAGGGLTQAWEALLPAARKFPSEPIIAYNLSCYACQMQQLDTARHWLQRAVMVSKKDFIKKMALADEDLQPLWPEIEDL